MAFYSSIAQAYDHLFPLNKAQVAFVEDAMGHPMVGKKVMDMGCGTGSLAIELGRHSATVRGFDYDAEMIALAEQKRPQALNVKFRQGDMTLLEQMYQGLTFDAIVCFGNTLVHLANEDVVANVIEQSSRLLNKGGKLLLQIINYDRVLDQQLAALPSIETKACSFERRYIHRPDGAIDFNTRLLVEGHDAVVNTVRLLALRKDALQSMLAPFFSEVSFYGGFDRAEWSPASFHCVIEAVK